MSTAAAIHLEDIRVQHDRLSGYLKLLRKASSPSKARIVLGEFSSFFQIHASDEEQFMEDHRYPDIERHRREHQDMIATIESLQSEDLGVTEPIADRLAALLVSHLREYDASYIAHFQAEGVLPSGATLCSCEI